MENKSYQFRYSLTFEWDLISIGNYIANIFGLGWVATPAGLKVMEELEEGNVPRYSQQCKVHVFDLKYFVATTHLHRQKEKTSLALGCLVILEG